LSRNSRSHSAIGDRRAIKTQHTLGTHRRARPSSAEGSALSAEERSSWQADIAAVRKAAAAGGSAMPTVDDPANPMRALTRLTMQEQLALNDAYMRASQTAMASCRKPQE
jgi:hypothetical protein